MTAGKGTIADYEAINIVGRAIFGDDWAGQLHPQMKNKELSRAGLSDDDRRLIAEYGPRPGKRGGLTIEPCPPAQRAGRDRALSKLHRGDGQRGAAMDWLIDHGLRDHGKGYEQDAVMAALKLDPPITAARGRGKPPIYEVLGAQMRNEVDSRKRSQAEIMKAGDKVLQNWYDHDPQTCKKARKFAFPNIS
jgi:hypothetical protein